MQSFNQNLVFLIAKTTLVCNIPRVDGPDLYNFSMTSLDLFTTVLLIIPRTLYCYRLVFVINTPRSFSSCTTSSSWFSILVPEVPITTTYMHNQLASILNSICHSLDQCNKAVDPFVTDHNPVDSAPFPRTWCHLQISTASSVNVQRFLAAWADPGGGGQLPPCPRPAPG